MAPAASGPVYQRAGGEGFLHPYLVPILILVRGGPNCHSAASPTEKAPRKKTLRKRKRTKLGKDKRRKHRHWQVTVYYHDGERFARVYTDRAKAAKFAERQKKSPVVKATRVTQVD